MLINAIERLLALLAALLLLLLVLGLLGSIDNATNQDDLVAWVVLDDESESAVGLDFLLSLLSLVLVALLVAALLLIAALLLLVATVALVALLALALAEDFFQHFLAFLLLVTVLLFLFVLLVIFILILILLVLILILVVLVLVLLLLVLAFVVGSADSLLVDLDGGLVDQFVHVQLLLVLLVLLLLVLVLVLILILILIFLVAILVLLLLTTALLALLFLVLLAVDSGEVGFVLVESILDTLLAQSLLGIDFVLDLEFGQFNIDLFLLLFGVFQQLFQLLTVLDLGLFDLVQTILVLGHDDVQGQFLLLSGQSNDLQLLVFVVVHLSLGLQNLDVLGLLASQWVEFALFGLLLLADLTAPFGFQLSGVDDDQFGVGGDGILGNDVLQFLVGLLGDVAVDLLTALFVLLLEVAFLDLDVQASTDGLDELLLSAIALVDDDGRGGLDLSLLVLASFLLLLLSLEALFQGGVGLLVLFLVQSGTSDALDLTLGIATSSALNSGQSQLDGSWGNDGVLVVVLLFSLLVQFGGQLGVGFFQGLQQLEFGLALVLLLLLAALLLVLLAILLALVASLTSLATLATLATLTLILVLVLILIILILIILILVIVLLVVVIVVFIVIQIQVAITLVALALTALLLLLVVVVLVVFILFLRVVLVVVRETLRAITLLLVLLLLQLTQQTVKAVLVGVAGAGHSQAESDQDEKTHFQIRR